jgi:Tfp pilus assembly ATPase PilU
MMGEIRDEESVEALMRLSSSRHRTISTLHTNSVCEVPSRFFLFQAHPFIVADSLKLAKTASALGAPKSDSGERTVNIGSPVFNVTINGGDDVIEEQVRRALSNSAREMIGLLRKAEREDFRSAIV